MFTRVEGVFYRSISRTHRHHVLDGSVRPGRYSRAGQPTLYLSESRQGVAAALKAHATENGPDAVIVPIAVVSESIFDLRDEAACAAAGIDRGRAFADWQDVVREGRVPPSWGVADTLRALGADGLIDPSRQAPGLWHLVLFRWNRPDGSGARCREGDEDMRGRS